MSKDPNSKRVVEFFDISKLASPETSALIKSYLEERGWNNTDLANQAGLDIETIEAAIENPGAVTIHTMTQIASAFGFDSMNDFLREETVIVSPEDTGSNEDRTREPN